MDRKTPDVTWTHGDGPLRAIVEALQSLEYGTVTLVIQDGRIIQVDRLEKRRLKK